jgi:hypothetical protein
MTGSTGTTGTGGFTGAAGISGADDSIVATPSTSNLAVVVGATQTLSITFASSDGLTMTGFGVSGALGTALPAGWSGPTSFVCAAVNHGQRLRDELDLFADRGRQRHADDHLRGSGQRRDGANA